MPATCTLITRPMTRRIAPSGPPAWPMCTGVMTMTPTITEWDTTTDVRPSRPVGDPQTARTASPWPAEARPGPAPPGGGRAAAGPAGAGGATRQHDDAEHHRRDDERATQARQPQGAPQIGPGPAGLGPSTEPTVAHTTSDRSRPRRSGGARSAAA